MIEWPWVLLAYLGGFWCGMAVLALIIHKEKK